MRQRLVLESASFFLPVYVCVLSIFHYVPSFDAWCDGSSAVDAPPRTGFHGRLGTPVSPSRLFLTRDESHPVLLTYTGALTRWRSLSEGRTPSYSSRLPGLACNVPVEKADRHGPHTHEGKKRLYLGGGSCFRLLSDGGGEQWHARQSHARQMARLGSSNGDSGGHDRVGSDDGDDAMGNSGASGVGLRPDDAAATTTGAGVGPGSAPLPPSSTPVVVSRGRSPLPPPRWGHYGRQQQPVPPTLPPPPASAAAR